MKISSFGITDIGRKRGANEDFYLLDDRIGLYVVADGMGGHAGGEMASKIAITTIQEVFNSYLQKNNTAKELIREMPVDNPFFLLKTAINLAGNRICNISNESLELQGMGTTVTSLYLNGNKAYIAHVGDSRCYLLRKKKIKQITEDHSLVYEQLKSGLITEDEAKIHQFKNIITRSVGVNPDVIIDEIEFEIKLNDIFLLCTDGLSNMIKKNQIQKIILDMDPALALRELVTLANNQGGEDNITALIVKIE